MASITISLFLFGMLHAEQAAADVNEAMKIGKAMSKFMPVGNTMPRTVSQDTAVSQSELNMQSAMLKTLVDMEVQSQEMEAEYQRLRARIENMPQATSGGSEASFGWLAGSIAFVGLAAAAVRKYSAPQPTTQGRAPEPQMYNLEAYDDVWGLEAKEEVYQKWDPEKPRNFQNFNPFERNDEGQMCDKNGCFPGQDRGYKPPTRPDVSWDIQAKNNARMDVLKTEAKYNIKGKPGNWSKGWADKLKAAARDD